MTISSQASYNALTPITLSQLFEQTALPDAISQVPASIATSSHLITIRIQGEDATTFLQGQFTNQLENLKPGEGQLNGYCNPKGRLLAIFQLLKDDQGYQMILPAELAEGLIKRLTLYKMRAKVQIEQRQDVMLFGAINSDPIASTEHLTTWALDKNRQLLIVNTDHAQESINNLKLPIVNDDLWKFGQILNGIPQVYESTYEEFIPQQINLDLAGGVSFTKGCYPGQEIVARIRYLGKLKQRMISVKTAINEANTNDFLPATPIYTEARGENKAGQLVDSVSINNTLYTSVMVPSGVIEEGEITAGNPNGPKLERLQPPYTITTEKESTK